MTQAGYKRIRASVACGPCRRRKAKCDASRPKCTTCLRLKSRCSYDGASSNAEPLSEPASPERRAHESIGPHEGGLDALQARQDTFPSYYPQLTISSEPATGSALLPYIDAFLQNVHPVGCNNFLHPGVLGEALGQAPRVLVLALCGVTSKFTNLNRSHEQGRLWIEEAGKLVIQDLGSISTLKVTVLQFLASHEMQEGRFMAAWNLVGELTDHRKCTMQKIDATFTGVATRMALQLNLNFPNARQPSEMSSAEFLRAECHSRLMWTIFVSDLLYAFDEPQVSEQAMADLYLPCNLWSFTQGTPSATLRMAQVSVRAADTTLRQATNPCAYFIKILATRRKIIK